MMMLINKNKVVKQPNDIFILVLLKNFLASL